jgi:hypothetical protein
VLPPWRCPISECEDRKRFQQQYITAVNAYGEALGKARSSKCTDRQVAGELTQRTSAACQKALKAFTDHIEEHGCHPNKTHTMTSGAGDASHSSGTGVAKAIKEGRRILKGTDVHPE